MQPFSKLPELFTISCSHKKFMVICQTVQDLSCWQTCRQTYRQTDTKKHYHLRYAIAAQVVKINRWTWKILKHCSNCEGCPEGTRSLAARGDVLVLLTLYTHIKTTKQRTVIQQCGDWYTDWWWMGCYIWYSEEGTGRGSSLPSPLLAVPNVTAHPSTASVPTSFYSTWHYNCLWMLKGSCSFNPFVTKHSRRSWGYETMRTCCDTVAWLTETSTVLHWWIL